MKENRYVFDNAVTAETGMRFSGLEATFDPATIGYLTGVGVTDGWACWEIGAGGGSIASWLAKQAGPTGSVPAAWPRSGEGRDLQRVQDEPELIGCHTHRGWSAPLASTYRVRLVSPGLSSTKVSSTARGLARRAPSGPAEHGSVPSSLVSVVGVIAAR